MKTEKQRLVVIGNGMAPGRALEKLFDQAPGAYDVTGHARDGELPERLDWCGLADPNTTLVFYMGGRTAPSIAERLMTAGLSAETPTEIMAGITRHDEQRWLGDLRSLAAGVASMPCDLPLLIGVGVAFGAMPGARVADPCIERVDRAALAGLTGTHA